MSTGIRLGCGLLAAALFAGAANTQCNRGGGGGGGTIIPPAPLPPDYRGPGDTTPEGPHSPGPAAPAAPAPAAPNTPRGGARNPHTPGGGVASQPTAAQPRGAAVTWSHRYNALQGLRIDWDYPSCSAEQKGPTVAPHVSAALPVADALRRLAGSDRRPLLILRECWACQGSETALLEVKNANEKTLLFARWFHCIRLDDSTRHEAHPFHLLFKEHAMPHLLLCAADGGTMTPLDGKRPQSALWSAMRKVLRASYTKDPDVAVRDLFRVLSEHDHLDSLEAEVSARLQKALETHPVRSATVQSLQAEIAGLVEQREALTKRQAEIMDLGLRKRDEVALGR
jgi:hypothetical protein